MSGDKAKSFYFIQKTGAPHEKDGEVELDLPESGAVDVVEQPSTFSWITGMFKPKGYQSISNVPAKTRKVPTKVSHRKIVALSIVDYSISNDSSTKFYIHCILDRTESVFCK